MMSYGGDGWVWCSALFNTLGVMVILGVITAAVVLAVRLGGAGRSGRSAGGDGAFARVGSPHERGDAEEDEFYRRLM